MVYSPSYHKIKKKKVDRNIIQQILGKEVFDSFERNRETLQFDESFCNFEKNCYAANEILTKKSIFTCLGATPHI